MVVGCASDKKPPRNDQEEKKVHRPDDLHPINLPMRACLQHFAHAGQHTRHAQRENDGD
jgi:hypothetical protein